MEMATKLCPRCQTEKDVDAFSHSSREKDGLQYFCKNCLQEINRTQNAKRKKNGLHSYHQKYRRTLRQQVLEKYGGTLPHCQCCGETTLEFLAIDHIEGGGVRHRTDIGQSRLYTWLKKHNFPDGYRVLCHNCNVSFGIYGYCPHQAAIAQREEPERCTTSVG
jgi:hypothetical protein